MLLVGQNFVTFNKFYSSSSLLSAQLRIILQEFSEQFGVFHKNANRLD